MVGGGRSHRDSSAEAVMRSDVIAGYCARGAAADRIGLDRGASLSELVSFRKRLRSGTQSVYRARRA